MLGTELKCALELRRQNALKPCSTRPDIASAGATAGSERFKCIKELIRRGGRPRRNNSGSRQGLRGSGVPDRAESEMHACISHKLIDMHAARYSWLRTCCRSKAAVSSWCRTQTCHLHTVPVETCPEPGHSRSMHAACMQTCHVEPYHVISILRTTCSSS